MPSRPTYIEAFVSCVKAIRTSQLIKRESSQDKEFHFQNWFKARLAETELNFEVGGRNSYPDFRLVAAPEGFEVKGLAYPGREANYDCNSQVPSGNHNGRSIFYVFGRYPAEPDGNTYPVIDLVICHGNFLNADHTYVHKNKSIKGFGSYGDIMIRDRKMYVAPTPFGLTKGTAHNQTLILPFEYEADTHFNEVGRLIRREADNLIIGYHFDLLTNTILPRLAKNPSAGKEHIFRAFRLKDSPAEAVSMHRSAAEIPDETDDE